MSAVRGHTQVARSSDAVVTTPAEVRRRREQTMTRIREDTTAEAVITSCGRTRVMDRTGAQYAECLGPVSSNVQAQNGTILCPQYAAQFYCPCAGCGGLIPQDEAVLRDGVLCCVQCLAALGSGEGAAVLSDRALAVLMAEFIQLHAEVKHLNERLDAVKEQLKRHAASQPQVANAVMLRTGEHAFKCGYSVRVSYHADKLAVVEALLGTEHFTALFTRKITFSAVKESLDAFLASQAADTAAARAAILAAAERTETTTVTPITTKRKTGQSGKKSAPPAIRPQP
jgi:hypothetical protein